MNRLELTKKNKSDKLQVEGACYEEMGKVRCHSPRAGTVRVKLGLSQLSLSAGSSRGGPTRKDGASKAFNTCYSPLLISNRYHSSFHSSFPLNTHIKHK